METALSLLMGVGLSAACGFRIFVPLLFMSLAALSGHLELAKGFDWIGSWPAFTAFSAATILEVTAYYVPWLDHLLDSVATPAAFVAGSIVTASVITDMSPFFRWTTALVAGGGAAGLVQGSTVLLRMGSTATSGGLANPLVATAELGGATATAGLALAFPVLLVCGAVAGLGVFWFARKK
jgi:hypothetical protein